MALQVWLPLNGDLTNNGLENVTISGSGTFTADGKIGKCLSGGSNIGITSQTLANSKTWSVCFWGYVVSANVTANWTKMIQMSDNGSNLRVEVCPKSYGSGTFCYSAANNASYKITTNSSSAPSGGFYDQWHHFCMTSDGTTICVYDNGTLRGTMSYNGSGAITGTFTLNNNSIIKKNDFRIYNTCLSPREVSELSKALILHYPLNNNGGGQPNLYNFESVASLWKTGSEELIFVDATDDVYGNVLKILVDSVRIYRGVKNVWKADTNFTVSFLAKASKTAVLKIERSRTDYAPDVTVGTTWKRYSTVISCTATATGGALGIQTSTASADIYITQIKVELGDKATAYCPGVGDSHYIPMGYDSTTEYDVSGYNYNGTKVGTLDYSSDTPRYSVSSLFNGSNCISLHNFNIGNEWSYGIWYRSSSLTDGWLSVVLLNSSGGDNDTQFGFYTNHKESRLQSSANGNYNSNISLPHDTNWHHYFCTYNGSSMKTYLDGNIVNTTAISNALLPRTNLTIGARSTNAAGSDFSYYFKGNLSDFRVYATCLSDTDIQKLYNTPVSLSNNGTLLTQGEFVEN